MFNAGGYEEICGCAKGRHAVLCVRRGRDKMTKEEYDADVLKEKEEKQAEAIAELREEAAEEIEKLRMKAEQYGVVGKLGIDALKTMRPTIKELVALTADELRTLFGEDLAPLGKLVNDASDFLVELGATQRAKLVKKLMRDTELSEATCLAVVLSSSEAITAAIKNAFDNKDTKKK